jgi:hypothetical protein
MLDHIHDPLGSKFTPDMRDLVQIKEAEDLANEDLSTLPDSSFALAVEFGDRYYPCHTPEHLALSRAYLHKYPDGMDRETFGKVASYMEDAASAFSLPPWSGGLNGGVETSDGLEQLLEDMFDFERNYRRMYVESRRSAANALRRRAEALCPHQGLPHIIIRYSGRHLRPDYMRAFDARRGLFADGSPMRNKVIQIGLSARDVDAETLVAMLKRFDEENGLTARYDDDLLDPYLGLLGDEPPPPREVYRDGDRRLCEEDVAQTRLHEKLKNVVDDRVIRALSNDFGDAMSRLSPGLRVVILKALG